METPGRTGYHGIQEAGRFRRGLLLGLTPLVSEPSWPPKPGQAWLRIALPEGAEIPGDRRRQEPARSPWFPAPAGLGFPQFTRFAVEGFPPLPPFPMSPLLCR
jgi:hypothetical protein